MAKTNSKLTDEDILAACKTQIDNGVGYYDSQLARERQRVLNYYNGTLPLPVHNGNSKYISNDVYSNVEAMKATLLETFSSGYDIVGFAPKGPEDIQGAKIASKYTSYVIFEQNNGYQLMNDVIHDALMARNGVCKVYWDKDETEEDEEFTDQDEDSLSVLLSDKDVEIKELTIDPETNLISGCITRKVDKSQVRLEVIPPEQLMVSTRAKSPKDSNFLAHRSYKLASDLKKLGMTEEEIDKLPDEDDLKSNMDELARLDGLAMDLTTNKQAYQKTVRRILVHECYIKLDVDGSGIAKLWKFLIVGDHILDREQLSRAPFIFFVPLPVPHAFFGNNFASKVIPIQNARSILMRGILDHTVITNNPRTIVVKGALTNPQEMLDNRIGGVVNVTRPDGIFPFPQASLNPFVFQTIGLLDQDKEDTNGISRLSQGLNKDAISNQNSQGLVENLVSLSQQRQKIVARNFANNFLIDLYLEVYRLVIENEKKTKVMEVTGNWIPINPEGWEERENVYVSIHLGYGEQGKESIKLLQLAQLLKSDPSIAPMFPIDKRYNLIRDVCEMEGVSNYHDYLLKPGDPAWKDPQPDPKLMSEVALNQAKAQDISEGSKFDQFKMQMQNMWHEQSNELKKTLAMLNYTLKTAEEERKTYDTKSKHSIAQQEIDLVKESPVADRSNIISPNG